MSTNIDNIRGSRWGARNAAAADSVYILHQAHSPFGTGKINASRDRPPSTPTVVVDLSPWMMRDRPPSTPTDDGRD